MRHPALPAFAAAALLLAACGDVTTSTPAPEARASAPAGGLRQLGTITCHVDVAAQTSRCGDLEPPGGGSKSRVTLTSSHYTLITGAQFNSGGLAHFFNEIRNDIGQDIGTLGLATDTVFAYVTSITTTGGSGTVTPSNHDGTRTFTAPNQAYWAYEGAVPPNSNTLTRTWQFNLPGTVTSWSYTIGVLAGVQFPDGWIEMFGPLQIPHGGGRDYTAIAYEWTGAEDTTGIVTWTTTNDSGQLYASGADRDAHVLGIRPGYAFLTASKSPRAPRTRTIEIY